MSITSTFFQKLFRSFWYWETLQLFWGLQKWQTPRLGCTFRDTVMPWRGWGAARCGHLRFWNSGRLWLVTLCHCDLVLIGHGWSLHFRDRGEGAETLFILSFGSVSWSQTKRKLSHPLPASPPSEWAGILMWKETVNGKLPWQKKKRIWLGTGTFYT